MNFASLYGGATVIDKTENCVNSKNILTDAQDK